MQAFVRSITKVVDVSHQKKRSENLELVESNKRKSFRKSFRIEQDNEKVTVNGKERKYKTLRKATEKYNQVIKKCLKKGFRRC